MTIESASGNAFRKRALQSIVCCFEKGDIVLQVVQVGASGAFRLDAFGGLPNTAKLVANPIFV